MMSDLLCPVKQCLIWLKLRCFSKILAIGWKIQILNVIKISLIFLNLGICCQIKNCPGFFWSYLYFWYYCRNSFELKIFLLILKYIEIL